MTEQAPLRRPSAMVEGLNRMNERAGRAEAKPYSPMVQSAIEFNLKAGRGEIRVTPRTPIKRG